MPRGHGGDLSDETPRVLIVDDDASHRRLIQHWLDRSGYKTETFGSGPACLDALTQSLPDAILLDLHMDGMDGHQTLQHIHDIHPNLPTIMLTGDTDLENVVKAMQAGACNYLGKPVDRRKLLDVLQKAIETYHQKFQVRYEERKASGTQGYGNLLGHSPIMQKLFRNLERVAPSNITVLIAGESGTGKELVAKAIHQNSRRVDGPFIALNCAAIPETLQESELFGHEKGAFTGANSRRIGRFEQAHGGTLFLDEVGELSPGLQAKLLRVIQERRFYRVGGSDEIEVDVRLLAATHQDLNSAVSSGNFREDLYYRLAVFEIFVPPLRSRTEDLPILTQQFVEQFTETHQRKTLVLAPEVMRCLEAYHWPGNVRELQNALERAVVVADHGVIQKDDLPSRIGGLATEAGTSASLPDGAEVRTMEDVERSTIEAALAQFNGNVTHVIRELGIPRTTLYRKLKKYGLLSTKV